MIVFLDANPVIYFIEQPAVWGAAATTRIAALHAAGDRLAVRDLVRMECQVGPLKAEMPHGGTTSWRSSPPGCGRPGRHGGSL